MASDYLEVPFKARKLTAIPAGLKSSVSLKSWVPLITYAVEQARNLRFYGSRFVNMHLTRLLSTHVPLGKLDENGLRRMFTALCDGRKGAMDADVADSVVAWKGATAGTTQTTQPCIRGMNTITTATFKTYQVAFLEYHETGLLQHYQLLVRREHNVSKAVAKVVAVRVLQHLDLPVKDSVIAFADDFKAKSDTVAAMDAIIENEKMLRADYISEGNGDSESKGNGVDESNKRSKTKRDEESLKRQVRMHYAVAKKLETTYNRHVAMAPLCDSRLPCIELYTSMHVRALRSAPVVYSYAMSQLKKKPDTSEETKASNELTPDEQKKARARANAKARAKARADAKPKRPLPKMTDAQVDRLKEPTLLTDILDQKLVRVMRARGRDMLTMTTDGIIVNMMWSRTVVLTRRVDDVAKYKREQAKYAAEKQERIAKQIKSKGKADARTVKGRAAKIMTPSKYRKVNRTGFHDGLGGLDNGLFTIAAAKRHKGHHIAPDTPIVSIDPGLKNIMTCATSTLDDMDPQPGRGLSLGEYYDRIGNRSYRFRVNKGKRKAGVDAAELAMSPPNLRFGEAGHPLRKVFLSGWFRNTRCERRITTRYSSTCASTRSMRPRYCRTTAVATTPAPAFASDSSETASSQLSPTR